MEDHRTIPAQPQPFKVSQDFRHQFGPAAGAIDVLDPQQELSAPVPRQIVRHDRRIGMAQMQLAVGTGGETGADHAPSCLWIVAQGKA